MKQRLIPDITAVVCVCLLAGSQISPAGADWTTKPSATGYYSNTGSFKTPPPGGWENVLDQEIQKEQVRREKESSEQESSEQTAGSSTQVESATPPTSAQTYNNTQSRQQQVHNPYNSAIPGFRGQGHDRHRSKGASRNRHRNRGSQGFSMPWGGDRGGSRFDMPWGGDRGGSGFDMPWGDDRGGRGFSSPWGDDGFGFGGPWDSGNRGGRGGRHFPW